MVHPSCLKLYTVSDCEGEVCLQTCHDGLSLEKASWHHGADVPLGGQEECEDIVWSDRVDTAERGKEVEGLAEGLAVQAGYQYQ